MTNWIKSWIQKQISDGIYVTLFKIRFGGSKVLKHKDLDWAKFEELGRKLVGKPYVFGAETDLNDPDPDHIKAIDCSETIEWLFHQIGVKVPDGSYNQAAACNRLIGAEVLPGDLGFKWHPDNGVIHHVGVVLNTRGDILEAKGKAWGVIITPMSKFTSSVEFAFWGRLKVIDYDNV